MGFTVDDHLIHKYNVQGPRYTSYPTALYFSEDFNYDKQQKSIKNYHSEPRDISLYIHIPFCRSLCWYCGCTKIICKDQDKGTEYLASLETELQQYARLLHPNHKTVQIHLGGGTPSFLKGEDLRKLSNIIHRTLNVEPDAEIGIEIDPREVSKNQICAMREAGFNRASIGIQDMNEQVQIAIHRIQTFEQTKNVVDQLRDVGIDSINADLIYGLPKQTPNLFQNTLDKSLLLNPDRYAIYSYAHVPWMKPSQKLIKEEDLPQTDEKLAMLKMAIEYLTVGDYEYIGMDHFSKQDNELSKALNNGTLQRNFQGYSTHSGVDIIGIGMSSISSIGNYYIQNTKNMKHYGNALESGQFPWEKAYTLSLDDQIRRDAIMRIMCSAGLDLNAISKKWRIDAYTYFKEEFDHLSKFESDGLVNKHPHGIQITKTGRLFVRNIAMVFDAYLKQKKSGNSAYSKTV